MSEVTKITDFELAEDLQEFIEYNPDVIFDDLEIEQNIQSFSEGTLLKVQKEIGSSIKIVSIEEVTEEIISRLD